MFTFSGSEMTSLILVPYNQKLCFQWYLNLTKRMSGITKQALDYSLDKTLSNSLPKVANSLTLV